MAGIRLSQNLRDILDDRTHFSLGVELVSTRGGMSGRQAAKARRFANDLTHHQAVDWVSITDNAGGNPRMSPIALGTTILYAGKEVLIHLTCKDLNRHGLESQLWLLSSQGFHNILALTGDYPVQGHGGMARPVFDIDSVALLSMISRMNEGLEDGVGPNGSRKLDATEFLSGAVVNNFKSQENHLMPQYLKLEKKIECGAGFIINQVGYNARKSHELILWMRERGLDHTPVIGNVYVLNPTVARLYHESVIPGVSLSDELLETCLRHGSSPDRGRRFFRELAARQIALHRAMGYRGVYLGGVHDGEAVSEILKIEASFGPDDWKSFSRDLCFERPGEWYLYEHDPDTGLARAGTSSPPSSKPARRPLDLHHRTSRFFHDLMFEEDTTLARLGNRICGASKHPEGAPAWMRWIEKASKRALYDCRDCGDCALAQTGFLCPESQCAKNMRNGPCGGSRGNRCEVLDVDCIWAIAYNRAKARGTAGQLLDHAPVFQDNSLRGTSSWAHHWKQLSSSTKPTQNPENQP